MRILAFDACLGAVSAAAGIVREDGTWAHVAAERAPVSAGHAEALMPMLHRVMTRAGLAFLELDRIAATVGPGGFTGVRVSVAAARAFLLASKADGVGLSTLDALAITARARMTTGADRPLAVAVDARRGMLFFSRYAPGVVHAEPALLPADEAARMLAGAPHILAGSGATAVAAHLAPGALDIFSSDLEPDAQAFAPTAARMSCRAVLKPIYLRPPDAKAQTSFVLPRAPA